MDRQKIFYSAEDVLLELARSSDEDNVLEESDESDDGDMLLSGKSEPILYR